MANYTVMLFILTVLLVSTKIVASQSAQKVGGDSQTSEHFVTLTGILERLGQLEVMYADLKAENQELKRLLSRDEIYGKTGNPSEGMSQQGDLERLSPSDGKNADVINSIIEPEVDVEVNHLLDLKGDVVSDIDGNTVEAIAVQQRENVAVENKLNLKFNGNKLETKQNRDSWKSNTLRGRDEDTLGLPRVENGVQKLTQTQDYEYVNGDLLITQIRSLFELYGDLKARLTQLDSISNKCAFSAARSRPLLGNDQRAQNVTFDVQFANKGKAFIKSGGVFTCQIPGIYYFAVTVRSYDNMTIGITLVKNGDVVVGLTTDPSERKVMQSQTVMLQLVAGDQVWLQLGPHKDFGIYSNNFNYITFSGFILYVNNNNNV